MKPLLFNYPSIQVLATKLHDEAEDADARKYSPRPYNFTMPLNTTWWLVPSTDWPAHPHGKYVFTPSAFATGRVLCGLHVEKGFGDPVARVPGHPPKHLLLNKSWQWTPFMSGLRDASVADAVQRVSASAGEPVILEVHMWVPGDYSQFDPLARYFYSYDDPAIPPPFAGGQVCFETDGSTLRLKAKRWMNKDTLVVQEAQRLSDLPDILARKAMEWLWIDVYLGVLPTLAESPDVEAWFQHAIWRDLLSPWRPWVV